MSDMMTFPNTVEEFMEQYKIVDTEKIYTNGTELVPIFRMKQWFEHISATDKNVGTNDTISRCAAIDTLKELNANGTNRGMIKGEDAVHRIEMLPPAQPEPCEDAVSRKAAIDGLNDAVHEHNITDFDAVATILALPSVTPKQRWIPCSERLPKAKQKVLVQYADRSMATKQCNDAGHLQWFYANAVAWMPAPEPWEGDAE